MRETELLDVGPQWWSLNVFRVNSVAGGRKLGGVQTKAWMVLLEQTEAPVSGRPDANETPRYPIRRSRQNIGTLSPFLDAIPEKIVQIGGIVDLIGSYGKIVFHTMESDLVVFLDYIAGA